MTDELLNLHYRPEDAERRVAIQSHANVSRRILAGRLDREWSQGQLGKAAGLSQSKVSQIEMMASSNPTFETLDKIAAALGLCIDLVPRPTAAELRSAATPETNPEIAARPSEPHE